MSTPDTPAPRRRRRVIIIDDGATIWGAYRDELFRHIKANGWTVEGTRVTNPPTERDDYGDATGEDAYTALCQDVQPAPGYDPRSWGDVPSRWRKKASLTAWPSDGPDCWILDA